MIISKFRHLNDFHMYLADTSSLGSGNRRLDSSIGTVAPSNTWKAKEGHGWCDQLDLSDSTAYFTFHDRTEISWLRDYVEM
uniref:Uncharacterized protein n=1 Tax=Romanomermis culicivorax TaxID=13658 RepID=A0A915JFD4_ROMCU